MDTYFLLFIFIVYVFTLLNVFYITFFLYQSISQILLKLSRYKINISIKKIPQLSDLMHFYSEKILNLDNLLNFDHFQQKIIDFTLSNQEIPLSQSLYTSQNNMDFFSQFQKDQQTSQIREILQTQQSQVSLKKSKKQSCHCKKTRCLKMYCQCFSQGNVCSSQCVCIGCYNDQKYHNSKPSKAKHSYKLQLQNSDKIVQQFTNYTGKGCNCKKSHCQKRYCECLNSNRKCGKSCLCIECKNCIQSEHIQKYKSSVITKQNPQTSSQQVDGQQSLKQEIQIVKKQDYSFILMSNQLLAEIDGYIGG